MSFRIPVSGIYEPLRVDPNACLGHRGRCGGLGWREIKSTSKSTSKRCVWLRRRRHGGGLDLRRRLVVALGLWGGDRASDSLLGEVNVVDGVRLVMALKDDDDGGRKSNILQSL